MLVALAACAARENQRPSARIPAWQQGSPVVYVHPFEEVDRRATVGILPFLLPAGTAGAEGRAVAGLFRDVFLGMRTFAVVRQLDAVYGTPADAVAAGRLAGVDYVLAGQVNSAMEGTELGGARLDLAVRLLNVRDGGTVWYISEAIDQPVDHPDLGFSSRLRAVFSPPPVRPSTGAAALPSMIVKIASDLAQVMSGAMTVRQ